MDCPSKGTSQFTPKSLAHALPTEDTKLCTCLDECVQLRMNWTELKYLQAWTWGITGCLNQRVANLSWLSVLIKFYWSTTTPICLGIIYGCVPATKAEFNSWDKDHTAAKAQNIYYLALEKQFANPWSKTTVFNLVCATSTICRSLESLFRIISLNA